MKHDWKKWLSLGLCAGLCTGVFAGTGAMNVKADDLVTLNMVIPGFGDYSDAGVVADAMNEILAEKYGIQVQLTYISVGAWTQQTNLLLTSDECDVTAFFDTPLTTYVNNGQALCLDDYWENASDEMKGLFLDSELQGAKVDGKLYAIPNIRPLAEAKVLLVSEDIANEMGVNMDEIKTMDDVGAFLEKAHEAYPDKYALVPSYGTHMVTAWSWDDLGLGFQNALTCIPNMGQGSEVQCTFETEDFKNFVSYLHDWYDKGYVMSDVLSNTESADTLILGGKGIAAFGNGGYSKPNPGLVSATIIEPWATSSAGSQVTYGINANSKHPDESWKLLEAVYTDPEVSTLLIDGIEGKHYVKNDDGTITYPEGLNYSNTTYSGMAQTWIYPNPIYTDPLIDLGDNTYFSGLQAYNRSAKNSENTGFCFDTSKCADAYSACVNVYLKYHDALLCGSVDPDVIIPQAVDELKSAGLETVMAEEQAQLDAFRAAE